jgi:hypothetical protein
VPCLFIFQSAFQYRCKHAPLAVFIERDLSKISGDINELLLVNGTLLFMSVDVFVFGLNIYIYYACPADTNVFLAADLLITHLPLLLYNIIPIVLFLRLKSIRNFILRPCKCINSDG